MLLALACADPAPEPAEAAEAAPPIVEVAPPAPPEPTIPLDRARALLFLDQPAPDCPDIRCLISARYADHPSARELALALWDENGDVAGVLPEQDFDGGFRGMLHLVPELPVGKHQERLEWALAAERDIASFVEGIGAKEYRHRAIAWRFFRSVGRTTPSAWASDWEVGFNVSGSLMRTREGVRDTVFHELFHLADQDHGNWSRRVLGDLVDGIVARCGTDVECLRPYAPGATRVRKGTWYAFQPDNGDMAHEYTAELATRFFLEHRAILAGEPELTAFKCATPANARAWAALSEEFFGGVDRTSCP